MTTQQTPPSLVQQGVKVTWQTTLASGVLSIIMGIIISVWPGQSTLAFGILFGIYLLVSGLFQVVAGLLGEARHRVLTVISGALSIVLGAFCFRNDLLDSVAILGIWIGISWIFLGITSISAGIADRGAPGRVWIVIMGILTLIAGIVLMVFPFTVTALVLVAGIFAIAIGVVEIIAALQLRSSAKKFAQQA